MLLDSESIELFDGMLVFDSILISIDMILLIQFFFSWYKNWKRTGIKLDYWNFFCFQLVVVPLLIGYPFAGSFANYFATGNDIFFIVQYVNEAFFISGMGYIFMILGRCLCNSMPQSHALNFVEEFFYKNLKNEKFYVYMGILSVFLFACDDR